MIRSYNLIIKFIFLTIAIVFIDALATLVLSIFFKNQEINSSNKELIKLLSLSSGLIFVILISRKFSELLKKIKNKINLNQILWVIVISFIAVICKYFLDIFFGKDIFPEDFNFIKILRVVLLIPILEELVFRGFFQVELTKKYNWKIGIIISTILFTVIHFGDLYHMSITFIFSLIAGLIFYRTNSLFLSILFHSLYNLGIILVGYYH